MNDYEKRKRKELKLIRAIFIAAEKLKNLNNKIWEEYFKLKKKTLKK